MAMVDMACYATGKPMTLQQIAQRQNIALNYLEQIFIKLKHRGLVKSVKGPGGGYLLTKDMHEIYIAEIMLAMNSEFNMTRCSKNNPKHSCMSSQVQCFTHHLWDNLGRQILDYLGSISLADIVNKNLINLDQKEIQDHVLNNLII